MSNKIMSQDGDLNRSKINPESRTCGLVYREFGDSRSAGVYKHYHDKSVSKALGLRG